MSKIMVIGSSNTDMVIRTERLPAAGETVLGGKFLMNPGGKGANQAVAAARLGGEVVFVARVGDDLFGSRAIEGLQQEGIDCRHITRDTRHASGVATITVDDKGQNCIAVAPGANAALSIADVNAASDSMRACRMLLVQLESPIESIGHAARQMKSIGGNVILNPAPAQRLDDSLLTDIDVITPNETEAELLTGHGITSVADARVAAGLLADRGVSTVIITLGSQGAYVHAQDFQRHIEAPKVKAVDTTAAGDTFNGALAVALAEDRPWEAATRFAVQAASIAVTRLGAQGSAPGLEELDLSQW